MAHDATRRSVLAVATAAFPLLASGCKGFGALGTLPLPRPDVAVVRGAITRETLMIARYEAVLAAQPTLDGSLRPLLAQHREHLTRLRARLIDPHPAATPRPTASTPPPTAPGTPAAALAYLRDAEHTAATTLLGQLATASPSLAQLLASIAASEATHAQVLSPRGRPG